MIKSKKLLSLLILSTALSFSACSGGQTNNDQQVTNVENNTSTSEDADSTPEETIKARSNKKANYDNLAEKFLLEVNDTRELIGALYVWDVYKPSAKCFSHWYESRDFTLTKEDKANCQLWVEEIAQLYRSYGYVTKPATFKSKLFWNEIEAYVKNNYRRLSREARENKTIPPTCARAPQRNYSAPELIESYKKPSECLKYEVHN